MNNYLLVQIFIAIHLIQDLWSTELPVGFQLFGEIKFILLTLLITIFNTQIRI